MRPLLNNRFTNHLKNNQGFTLIEILVALVLMALILSISISNPFSSRDDLDKDVNSIERAIRYMSDEAALKNAVVRLHLMLDRDPQEYAVEYGPSDSFILPPTNAFETTVESKEEVEKKKKDAKNLNLKFNKVQEFQDKNNEMTRDIKIIGVGTGQSKKLLTDGEVSIYAFPSGEKDEALVLVASDEDIISLEIDPFTMKINRKSYPLETSTTEKDLNIIQQTKAREIFEKWQKEK